MGCDIHSFAEKLNKKTNKWEKVENAFTLDSYDKERMKKDKGEHPFDWRNYSLFAFLANVRNYDHCEPLSEPKGIPKDICEEIRNEYEMWECDAHSASYFTSKELLDFDYEKTFWNRRVTKQISANGWNGASLAEEGEGKIISYRENLGELNYHVSIKNKDDFENFCSDNNIGYHDGARKDIVKSSRHIFTLNKDVFENFQNDAETIN